MSTIYNLEEDITPDQIAAEEAMGYSSTDDLTLARRVVEETGANLFLTGKAGTGKTTFLRNLRRTSSKRMIVLAPTGIAAINAQGMTIHSFFQLPLSPYIPGYGYSDANRRADRFSRSKLQLIRGLDLLVIDEISMVRPDTLDAVDAVLRRHRDPRLPFGGVQLLLIGDLRQLAPVVRDKEWQILSEHYPTPYFFESKALKEAGFVSIELRTIFRQNDEHFIEILNAIRDGNVDSRQLSVLNSRYRPNFNPPASEGYIRLTTHNERANRINAHSLELLNSPAKVYAAQVINDFPDSAFPADAALMLKVGAQVMFIRNDHSPEHAFYNGLLGRIVELNEEYVVVEPLDGSPLINVSYSTWDNIRFSINDESKEITEEVIGQFKQLPLRLAWAITIHKSQGLTFNRAIVDAGASFAPGQTYVALSRCKSLEGLVLNTPLHPRAVISDPTVNDFIHTQTRSQPTEAALDRLSLAYYDQLIRDLFNFGTLYYRFTSLRRRVDEFLGRSNPHIASKYAQAEERINKNLREVCDRFVDRYRPVWTRPQTAETHPLLLKRISDACGYFRKELGEIRALTAATPTELRNKLKTKQLKESLQGFNDELSLKFRLHNLFKDKEFSTKDYIREKSNIILELNGQKEKAAKKATPKKS